MAEEKDLSQMTAAELQAFASQPKGESQLEKTPDQIKAEADAETAKLAAGGAGATVSEPNYKEIFGEGFEKLEDVKTKIPTILKEHKSLNEEKSKWSDEKTLLEKQIESLQSQFADDSLYKVNELAKKTGRKDWDILAKVVTADTEKMQDIDVLILNKVYQNPQTDVFMLRKFIEKKYGIDGKPDPDATEEEKAKFADELELAKYQLKEDANSVRKEFTKIREDIKLPEKLDPVKLKEAEDKKKADNQKAYDETVKAWEDINKTFITTNMKSISFMTKGKDGKEEKFIEYEVPPTEVDGYVKDASRYMTDNRSPFEKSSLDFVHDYVRTRVKDEHETDILMAYAEKARKLTDDEWVKKVNNPSALINTDKKDGDVMDKNKEEEQRLLKEVSRYS